MFLCKWVLLAVFSLCRLNIWVHEHVNIISRTALSLFLSIVPFLLRKNAWKRSVARIRHSLFRSLPRMRLLCQSMLTRHVPAVKNTVGHYGRSDLFSFLVKSQVAGFNLVLSVYVCFTLKAVSPIDCRYITDRLQRFELKIFVCVLLKKQRWHLGCPQSKQINITSVVESYF